MTVSQFQSGRRQRTRRGVSLIEVLVVLVILVTGILTIIRLFPSGFFSIQSTGNAALANSLGGAAINLGIQNAGSLPEAIIPDNLALDDLASATTNAAAYSNYDPDNPNNLENARVVLNETTTVPSPSQGHSVYVVRYGPIAIGTVAHPLDPATASATALSNFMSVNSPSWTIQTGSSVADANPKDLLNLNQPGYLADTANGQIALPYAVYDRSFVLTVVDANNVTHTLYLTVPKAHAVDMTANSTYQNGPISNDKLSYQVSTATDYNGRWFDPSDTTLKYVTLQTPSAPTLPALDLPVPWRSVSLYRPYNWIQTGTAFDPNDPYQFQLVAANIGGSYANTGAVEFNPLAGGAKGLPALKAEISYVAVSWSILHEDYDIPALSGSATAVVRTSVPNLLLAGSAKPDNTINSGIAGSSSSVVIIDLDTGQYVAPFSTPYDPTTPDKPINNEDVNGTITNDPTVINISYSLGRLTFGSQVFSDGKPHRVRVFYTADLNWTVAVQKAPAYFQESVTTPTAGTATGTTPLAAYQFAVDSTSTSAASFVYFARCNANKTVEIDGTYTLSGATKEFSNTVAISPVLNSVGDSNVRVDLADGNVVNEPVLPGATGLKITAVRGLSARSVVAWKERNVYKVHSVDTILNRTP